MKDPWLAFRRLILAVLLCAALLPAALPLHAAALRQTDAQPVELDVHGQALVAGSLDAGDAAGYVLTVGEGATVQAVILPSDTGLVLEVVGADGESLQTADDALPYFDAAVPVGQEYTFTVVNTGAETQEFEFAVSVTQDAPDDDTALGMLLVTRFYDALQTGDPDEIGPLLAPAFQMVRSTGDRYDAATFADFLPVFEDYAVRDLYVTRDGDVLVATYFLGMDTTLDGTEDFGPAAPRVSVFQQIDEEWLLLAHSNFAPPDAGPTPAPAPEPAPEPIPGQAIVTEDDNGGMVEVPAGGVLQVDLPGNPTTGYIWEVVGNDESILRPAGYEFVPAEELPGAGGVERFAFQVMAPGTVELHLVNHRPWETDTPPQAEFAVTVVAGEEWPADAAALITVGMADDGATVTIFPGTVLMVMLEGPADGSWIVEQGDAMVVQPLGEWQQTPDPADDTQAVFARAFLGVTGGTTDLHFQYVAADGSDDAGYSLMVEVAPLEPGSSGAVEVDEFDTDNPAALITGDTLVVRLYSNPSTGYVWRVLSTDDERLPAAGEPGYGVSDELVGGGGVDTFRFLARGAGEVTVELGQFPPGEDKPERTLTFAATIVDPAPLTGNTVTATADNADEDVLLAAGDWLTVELPGNPATGYAWRVVANDGAVLRLLPDRTFTPESDALGAPGIERLNFRAMAAGEVELSIGLFPPGESRPSETFDLAVTVE